MSCNVLGAPLSTFFIFDLLSTLSDPVPFDVTIAIEVKLKIHQTIWNHKLSIDVHILENFYCPFMREIINFYCTILFLTKLEEGKKGPYGSPWNRGIKMNRYEIKEKGKILRQNILFLMSSDKRKRNILWTSLTIKGKASLQTKLCEAYRLS